MVPTQPSRRQTHQDSVFSLHAGTQSSRQAASQVQSLIHIQIRASPFTQHTISWLSRSNNSVSRSQQYITQTTILMLQVAAIYQSTGRSSNSVKQYHLFSTQPQDSHDYRCSIQLSLQWVFSSLRVQVSVRRILWRWWEQRILVRE